MGKRIKAKFYLEKKSKTKKYYRRIFRIVLAAFLINMIVVVLHIHTLYHDDINRFFSKIESHIKNGGSDIEKRILADSISIKLHHRPIMYAGHSYNIDSIQSMFDRDLHSFYFKQTDSSHIDRKTQRPVTSYYGIDVSEWQQNIDWANVHRDSLPDKLRFFIIKATQGESYVDRYFDYNWANAKHKNTIVGAYHFYVYEDDPKKQAANYIKTVSLSKGDILPIVDVELDCAGCTKPEVPEEKLIADLQTYLDIIEDHFKVKPILYTYTYFYDEYLKGYFNNYVFWISQFSTTPPNDLPLKGSDEVFDPLVGMWQFTNNERINGIVGNVDMNYVPVNYLDSLVF